MAAKIKIPLPERILQIWLQSSTPGENGAKTADIKNMFGEIVIVTKYTFIL